MWAIRRSIDAGSVRQECFWREQGLGHTSTYIRARKLTRAKMCSHQRFYQFLGLRRKQVQPFYNFIHFHHSSFSYIILHLARAPPSAIAWIHRTSSAATQQARRILFHCTSFTFENIITIIISFRLKLSLSQQTTTTTNNKQNGSSTALYLRRRPCAPGKT